VLQKIWPDTTQAQSGRDTPQPEETLRTVRAVNASLRHEQQIRVLLGDPPIRWEDVKTKADHSKWIAMRETFPAEVVQREVLAKTPSLVVLRGTDLGAQPVSDDGPRVSVQTGRMVPVPRDQWRSMRMEDQYDARLYLGPRLSWSYAMVSPALCADPTYVEMRTSRMALVEWKSDQFEDYCGKVRPAGK